MKGPMMQGPSGGGRGPADPNFFVSLASHRLPDTVLRAVGDAVRLPPTGCGRAPEAHPPARTWPGLEGMEKKKEQGPTQDHPALPGPVRLDSLVYISLRPAVRVETPELYRSSAW